MIRRETPRSVNVSFRNLAVLAALSAAAALSWYFSRPPAQMPESAFTGEGAPPGYYLRDATLLGTDEAGRLLLRIHAAEAVQERDREGLELTGVHVAYRDEEAVNWVIRAERAVTPDDQSYVDMEGVRLENEPGDTGERMTIEAAHLRLDPEAYFVSTDGAVDIRIGSTTLGGVGLEARLREDVVELKSQVHGVYTK